MDTEIELNRPSESENASIAETDSDSAIFYINKDGVNYGPESAANLRSLCAGGWLQREDLVWQEGQPEWQPAEIIFAPFFRTANSPVAAPEPPLEEPLLEEDGGFFAASAVHIAEEMPWPWTSVVIAIVAHVILIFLILELLQFFPVDLSPYTAPPSQDPPMEMAIVPEAPPTPPPPPATTPPPPDPTPPVPQPPPPPVPELPPPPPAPAEMPLPAAPLPPLPPDPVPPDNIAPVTPPPVPQPQHHKTPRPPVHEPPPVATPEPPPADAGQPEYLSDPRPDYPFIARQRRQEGTVLLLVTMDDAGNPISVSVEQSSGYKVLDEAALKKVRAEWRFKPGQGSTVHVPVEFHLQQ